MNHMWDELLTEASLRKKNTTLKVPMFVHVKSRHLSFERLIHFIIHLGTMCWLFQEY